MASHPEPRAERPPGGRYSRPYCVRRVPLVRFYCAGESAVGASRANSQRRRRGASMAAAGTAEEHGWCTPRPRWAGSGGNICERACDRPNRHTGAFGALAPSAAIPGDWNILLNPVDAGSTKVAQVPGPEPFEFDLPMFPATACIRDQILS